MKFLFAVLVFCAPVALHAGETLPAKPKKVHRICRDIQKPGSHIETSVCKTAAEWAGTDAASSGDVDAGIPGNRVATGRMTNTGTPGTGPGK